MRFGGCLCGGVRYALSGSAAQEMAQGTARAVACHCAQCARTSGHVAVMTACPSADLSLVVAETLAWYASSPGVRRGFCARCGGNLFWEKDGEGQTYVTAGTLDRPTGVRLAGHIFVASRADYDDLTDDLPRAAEW